MTTNDVSRNDAGAYALGALDPHESTAYERFLTTSDNARREAEEFATAATYLATIVTPVSPSPAVKQNLMNRIAATGHTPEASASSAHEHNMFTNTNTLPLTLPVGRVPPQPDALTGSSDTLV